MNQLASHVLIFYPNATFHQDGIALPPQIGFDIDFDASEIPSPRYSFFVDPAAFPVEAFLLNYFGIYDSDNRQPLEMVYHEQALFSLTAKRDISRQESLSFVFRFQWHVSPSILISSQIGQLSGFQSKFVSHSRIRCEMASIDQRQVWRCVDFDEIAGHQTWSAFIHRGFHPLHGNHFSMEMCREFWLNICILEQNDLVLLTTTGIFCEQDEQHTFSMKEQFMRSFHRSFIITKKLGGGFGIINDMLHINSLTRDQEKVAFVENTGLAPTVTSTPSAANTYAFTVPLNDTIADDEME